MGWSTVAPVISCTDIALSATIYRSLIEHGVRQMNRESINPTEWGLNFCMDQGEVTEGATRHLRCSGQISAVPDSEAEMGISVVAPGDIRGQIECVLSNIDGVLEKAGMSRSSIVNLRFYTTDVDAFLENYDVYAGWISEAGIRPPQTLLGVARLAMEGLMIEIEAEAAA
jgi:enamine deaminase RidA (YjgF/YER057c/UK114 family)